MTKNKQKIEKLTDPYAKREANKYAKPIASRELLLQILTERGKLMTMEQLAAALKIIDDDPQEALHRRLGAMLRDGQLVKNRKKQFGVAKKLDLIPGRVIAKSDGFGFLALDAGGDDVFLSPKQMRGVLDGDRVLISISSIDRRGRREGTVVEVLERAHQFIVGRLIEYNNVCYVNPDNRAIHQDILIAMKDRGDALDGQIVEVEITKQPSRRQQPIGRVIAVLGNPNDAGMAIDVAIRSHDLPREWSDDSVRELEKIPDSLSKNDFNGRVDLRDMPLVTIDGADARDFDDAVFCEPRQRKNGQVRWRLVVAIADVSAYIKPGTSLDADALKRGTSAYFPERVVPMLPEKLSNGLCSLKPNVDRLCMVCEMTIDENGQMVNSRFKRAVMRSHARLTYGQVADAIGDGASLAADLSHLKPHLDHLNQLFRLLFAARTERGAIEFESVEPRFEFSETGEVSAIHLTQRNDAHRIIEECMILANVAAARFLIRNKAVAVFRNHEKPKADKIADLRQFLAELGLSFGGSSETTADDFSTLIDSIQERPDRAMIEAVLLRSQNIAVYELKNSGHFGLVLDAYAHFTSPIRRYPDLLVHRAISFQLERKSNSEYQYTSDAMEQLASHCCMAERRAEKASRDAIERLKCLFMVNHVGDVFDGTITGVTSFGLFVELDASRVSGLIHVTQLSNDYFHFDPVHHRLRGERSGVAYRLSDKVRVQVTHVDVDERKIDLRFDDAANDRIQ